jgi:hypothetical protein
VTVEDLPHQVVHLRVAAGPRSHLLIVQEARRGIRDRLGVVGDLEDRDPAHAHGDLLGVDALDVEDGLVGLERQILRLLERRDHERPAAGDDLEGLAPADGAALGARAGDDQSLVRGRHLPQHAECDGDQHQQDNGRGDRGQLDAHGTSSVRSYSRATTTWRGGS